VRWALHYTTTTFNQGKSVMLNEIQLKQKLQALAKNEFRLSANEELAILIPDMLLHIGATDSLLRDDLIYTAFATWILEYNILSPEQLQGLLQQILGKQHMFHNIGENNTDTVFRRSFSVLLLPLLLIKHRSQPFLTKAEIQQIKEKLFCYLNNEKDRRGFVNEKGWAHAIAHAADALNGLVQCTEIGENDLREILETIQTVISTEDIAYICGEDERMVTVATAIIKRQLLPDTEIAQWIQGFADHALIVRLMPQRIIIRTNIKNFLQSLYFRLQWEQLTDNNNSPISKTLHKISLFTNQEASN
jgi:hypothetical protein